MSRIRYYKFDIGNGAMRRIGAVVEYLDEKGNWIEDRNLIRKFIGGDTDFEEISEEEANQLVENRKKTQGISEMLQSFDEGFAKEAVQENERNRLFLLL